MLSNENVNVIKSMTIFVIFFTFHVSIKYIYKGFLLAINKDIVVMVRLASLDFECQFFCYVGYLHIGNRFAIFL